MLLIDVRYHPGPGSGTCTEYAGTAHPGADEPDLRRRALPEPRDLRTPPDVEAFCADMRRLRDERDVAWSGCARGSTLASFPDLLPRMAESGLIRLEVRLAAPPRSGSEHCAVEAMADVVERAVQAGIPQVGLTLVIAEPPVHPDAVVETAAEAERFLRLRPGAVEVRAGFAAPPTGGSEPAEESVAGCSTLAEDPPVSCHLSAFPGMIRMKQGVETHVRATMRALLDQDLVPENAIRAEYRNTFRYSLPGLWYSDAFRRKPWLDGFFRLTEKGEAIRVGEISPGDLDALRPMRTWDIRKGLDLTEGYPCLAGQVLSPLEFELLLSCSGKQTWQEVMAGLATRFGSNFSDLEELAIEAHRILEAFDRQHWVVVCPW